MSRLGVMVPLKKPTMRKLEPWSIELSATPVQEERTMDLGSSAGCGPPFGMRRIPLDHGVGQVHSLEFSATPSFKRSSGGQNLRSAKLQA